MRIIRLFVLMATVSASGTVVAAGTAAAQARPDSVVRGYDDTRAQRLFGELMSPFCPGLTLATCPSPGADSLRDDIRTRLALGASPRQIRTRYAAAWGEEILGAPPWRGWGVALWLMPGIALAAAAAVLLLWLSRARRAGAGPPAPGGAAADPLDERLRKRLEEELAAFDDR
jgi:cytochrome c-type biogenesis protein CcmH/NrfF